MSSKLSQNFCFSLESAAPPMPLCPLSPNWSLPDPVNRLSKAKGCLQSVEYSFFQKGLSSPFDLLSDLASSHLRGGIR